MLDQLGNWIGEMTGWNQAQRANADQSSTNQWNALQMMGAMQQYGNMNRALQGVVGGGDPMQRAQQQYQQAFDASQQAGADQAQQAGRQTIMAGRTAGLNPGQAALMAGQQTGQNYLAGQQQALGQYRQAQDAATSAQLQAAGMSAGLAVPGLQRQQGTDGTQATSSFMGGLGTLAGAGSQLLTGGGMGGALAALSDKDAKTGIQKDGGRALEKVSRSLNSYDFKYKGDDKKRVGVMAQDLEKTPLSYTVQKGPDGLRRVDTAQLTMANTAMLTDLAKKLDDALGIYKEGDK
jgi:hypothetical protein